MRFKTFPSFFLLASLALAGALIFNVLIHVRLASLDKLATLEWILSILCFVIGILWWRKEDLPTAGKSIDFLFANKKQVVTLFGLFSVGLFVRQAFLMQHPYPWTGDEAEIGLEGIQLLTGEKTYLFGVGWSGQPNVSFLPAMFSMMLFGRTMFAIKLVSVLVGAFSIPALYLLAREWFDSKVALLASLFLIAYPVHLQFSRIGVGNIFDSLMAPLTLWLIFRASRTGGVVSYLLAGLLTGASFYLYVGTRLVLAFAIGAWMYIAITRDGFLRANARQLAIYFGALLVTINPIAVFFIKYPGLFMTRIGQEGIFLNGWLEMYMAQTGLTVWQVLRNQFVQTVQVFFYGGTAANFLNFDRPYLTILGSLLFLIGYGYSLLHLLDRRHFILQTWFWSVLILGGVLTINPPANTRLVMVTPATGLFIALGIWQVSFVLTHLHVQQTWIPAIRGFLIIALAVQNLLFYFVHYYQGRFFADASGEIGMETGLELQRLGPKYDYILFGDPLVYADIPTTVFLAPENKKVNLTTNTLSEFYIEPGHGAFVAAIPENEFLLKQVASKYPGGEYKVVYFKMKPDVLYYAYILPPPGSNVP